ncbi:unnamed protein product [Prunus brigantina]
MATFRKKSIWINLKDSYLNMKRRKLQGVRTFVLTKPLKVMVLAKMKMNLVYTRKIVGVQSYSSYYMWMTY